MDRNPTAPGPQHGLQQQGQGHNDSWALQAQKAGQRHPHTHLFHHLGRPGDCQGGRYRHLSPPLSIIHIFTYFHSCLTFIVLFSNVSRSDVIIIYHGQLCVSFRSLVGWLNISCSINQPSFTSSFLFCYNIVFTVILLSFMTVIVFFTHLYYRLIFTIISLFSFTFTNLSTDLYYNLTFTVTYIIISLSPSHLFCQIQ